MHEANQPYVGDSESAEEQPRRRLIKELLGQREAPGVVAENEPSTDLAGAVVERESAAAGPVQPEASAPDPAAARPPSTPPEGSPSVVERSAPSVVIELDPGRHRDDFPPPSQEPEPRESVTPPAPSWDAAVRTWREARTTEPAAAPIEPARDVPDAARAEGELYDDPDVDEALRLAEAIEVDIDAPILDEVAPVPLESGTGVVRRFFRGLFGGRDSADHVSVDSGPLSPPEEAEPDATSENAAPTEAQTPALRSVPARQRARTPEQVSASRQEPSPPHGVEPPPGAVPPYEVARRPQIAPLSEASRQPELMPQPEAAAGGSAPRPAHRPAPTPVPDAPAGTAPGGPPDIVAAHRAIRQMIRQRDIELCGAQSDPLRMYELVAEVDDFVQRVLEVAYGRR